MGGEPEALATASGRSRSGRLKRSRSLTAKCSPLSTGEAGGACRPSRPEPNLGSMDELDGLRRRRRHSGGADRLALLMAWAGWSCTSSQAQTTRRVDGSEGVGGRSRVGREVGSRFDALSATLWTHPELRRPVAAAPALRGCRAAGMKTPAERQPRLVAELPRNEQTKNAPELREAGRLTTGANLDRMEASEPTGPAVPGAKIAESALGMVPTGYPGRATLPTSSNVRITSDAVANRAAREARAAGGVLKRAFVKLRR